MNSRQRISGVIIGFLTILMGLVFFLIPEEAPILAALILSISLIIYGGRMLVFYFRMARHMVSGRMLLYISVVLLDLGVFLLSLTDVKPLYIAVYLLIIYAFSGAIDIMRGFEAKKLKASSWKLRVISGFVSITVAILCVALSRVFPDGIGYLYGAGLIYSGIVRIVSAFRKTAIVYIQ